MLKSYSKQFTKQVNEALKIPCQFLQVVSKIKYVKILTLLMICFAGFRAYAGDIVEIIPVTDQIIMIKFSDGYLKYNKKGEGTDKTQTFKYPLDMNFIMLAGSYNITSNDDAAYSTLVSPSKVGRKSKPTGVSNLCNWNGSGCINDYTSEHWVYLYFPNALKRGKSYTINFKYLADNMNSYTFKFDEFSQRSEAVHTNQIGYDISAGYKYGYVGHWMGDMGPLNLDKYAGKNFYLVDLYTKAIKYTGQMALRKKLETGGPDFGRPDNENGPYNNAFGADLYECNFSSFNTPGEYLLVVEGIGSSYPFEIKSDVYREAFYHSARAIYHNRTGIALTAPYTRWTRPKNFVLADGFNPLYSNWRSMDDPEASEDVVRQNLVPNKNIPLSGWIADAGDWDPYPRHINVPIMLLSAYELAQDNFKDGELNIPESGNGIPDILDIAGWEIYFLKRSMKVSPTGGVIARINFFGTLPDGVPSWETPQTAIAFAEEPQSSMYFAGGAAQLAYNLNLASQKLGIASIADSSASLISDARKAYTWALNNMKSGDIDKIKSDIMFAAAWLYKYTGEDQYNNKFLELNDVTTSSKGVDVLGGIYDNTKGWAAYAYATSPDYTNINAGVKSTLRTAAIAWADDRIISSADKKGARNGYEWSMPSVVGSTTTPATAEAMFAYKFTGNQKYRDYIYLASDYFLGGNAANMTWMTGVGDRKPEQDLHLDSHYNVNGIDEPYPGAIVYGPQWSQIWGGAYGPWQPNFIRDRLYPDHTQFPIEDTWANNRFTPQADEFTVDQEARGIMTYAFLTSAGGNAYIDNKYPLASITSPASGTVFNERDSINFTTKATDADGQVVKVEYYNKGRKLGESTMAPFNFTLKRAYADSTMEVYAVATDNKGAQTLSIDRQKISLRVNTKYKLPTVQFVKPDSLSNQPEGSNIVIQTAVADAGGSVVKVEFFNNGQKIGESNSAPFSYTITNAKAGIYKISALAYDNNDSRGSSKILTFTVNGPKAPFYGSPANIPGIIEVEDYDKGGPGVGYKTAATTVDQAYRQDYGTLGKNYDLSTSAFTIVSTSAGDWMDYSVNVAQAGNYDVEIRYACGSDGKTMDLLVDGSVVKTLPIPNIGWWPFNKTVVSGVPLPQGSHTLRLMLTTGGVNLNYLRFSLPGVALDVTKPVQTYSLASSAVSNSTVSLQWTQYTDDIGVTVYDIFQDDFLVKSVTGTSGTVSGLNANTTYKFSVRARDAAANTSGLGNEINVKTSNDATPTVPVTGVSVSQATASVVVGATTTLTATVSPSNATNSSVSWTSSDNTVATVSSSGVVTGIAVGSATVTATAEGKTATSAITVKASSSTGGTNIALNKTATSSSAESANTASNGNDGSTNTRWSASSGNKNEWWEVDLGANYDITGDQIIWEQSSWIYKYKIEVSSDNANWTTAVDKTNNTFSGQTESDNFTASKVRYVRLTVTGWGNNGYWTSLYELKVFGTASTTGGVTAVTVSPTTTSVLVGATTTLTAAVSPANVTNSTVSWTSSDNTVATVSSNGVVTGVAAGNATVTASADGKSATTSITVTASSTSGTNIALNKTATSSSAESANPAGNGNDGSTNTRWSASSGSTNEWWKVDLGANYDLTGDQIIWENSSWIYKYKIEVSADNANWTVAVDKTNNTFSGQTESDNFVASNVRYVRLTVTGWGNNGFWTSLYELKVFGTASTGGVIGVTGVSISPATASVIVGATTTLTAAVSPANATNASVSWTSSDNAVATVSASGVVTGVAAGNATVTATAGGKTATTAITVTAQPNSSSLGISITSPTNNQTIAAGSNLSIQVSVTGNVAKVYYWYDDYQWLNLATSGPWSTTWNNVPAGTHSIKARVEDVNGNRIDAGDIKFVVTSSGRLANVKAKSEIKQLKAILSPNPAEREVTVVFNAPEVGSSQISITDMNGNVVFKTTASGTSATLNISALRPGMYVVRVVNESFSLFEKLIVQ